MNQVAFAQKHSRSPLLNELRGLSLLGLFLLHLQTGYQLYWYQPAPVWDFTSYFVLAEGSVHGLIALLFGLSFFVVLKRYHEREIEYRPCFTRRLTVVFLLGYLHSLWFAGDILQVLAVSSILMIFSFSFSNRCWLAVSAGFVLQLPQIAIIGIHSWFPDPGYNSPVYLQYLPVSFEHYAHSTLPALISYNLGNGQVAKWAMYFETGQIWCVMGLIFIGGWIGRRGLWQARFPRNLYLVFTATMGLGIYRLLDWFATWAPKKFDENMARWCFEHLLIQYQALCIILAVICLIMAAHNTLSGNSLLKLFAPVGRMSLTFYLMQSLVFVIFFYGFGLDAYQSIGAMPCLVLGASWWVLQIHIANFWLPRFGCGPVEWIWNKRLVNSYRPQTKNPFPFYRN
ncbi:DUF418 domain-containing protein [Alteromonas aestuariivivens]|uniref:DUF418 domain-containing protein n=1 Tax=Alteromonas aestuariivivens TaxID=1938339 RepID=A0A3D8M3X6_9ALTE|nr:DUF418 domain-containing protein [Alteromonas aestuariivivens]RDV24443.1 DUF418 domain-containing protein [Alteromonas aestuariivivens]